ncbi:UNVERIFIED_ORG: type I restriction enzyme S subunit [Actinomadura viridilutea]
MLDRSKATGKYAVPYLRNVNVQWGRIDLNNILTMDIPPEERELFRLQPGDLLVCEGGEIGRCAIWPGSAKYMAYQKALHRVRPHSGVEANYLRYLLEHMSLSGLLTQYATGSTIKHLPQQKLRRLPVNLPPTAEQRRIVAALEHHLSRLTAADAGVSRVAQRLKLLTKRILVEAVPVPGPDHWKLVSVADAGSVELGRARHPDWHTGPHMRPYLRVANVFEDRIDTSDLMEMDFPPEVFERYRLMDKDILLNEGQSPEFLGRPAMYRGVPENVAFTNSLLRFRAGPGVLPEWALLVFRRHMHAGRFIRELRITTNIAHLSATRLKKVEFPIPPMEEQERIVAEVHEKLAAIQRLADAVDAGTNRAQALRRALLAEAFAGRLVEQDPADEPASVLLERIRAERAARQPGRRGRRGKNGTVPQKETLV